MTVRWRGRAAQDVNPCVNHEDLVQRYVPEARGHWQMSMTLKPDAKAAGRLCAFHTVFAKESPH